MAEHYDYRQEDHAREVERALMYIAQAQRKCEQIATELAKEEAEERLVAGLWTAAGALKSEHNRLLNTSHFPVPDESNGDTRREPDAAAGLLEGQRDEGRDDPDDEQQRMAI